MLATGLVLAFNVAVAAAGPWALSPLEGINVGPGHVAAAQQVLKDHLATLGQAVVPLEAGVADPAAAAREKGAVAVLRGTLTRLGQKVKVTVTLQPLEGAPRSAALDAASPEDLDPVLMRIARNLVSGAPLADARINEVTEQEADPYKRRRANSYFGVNVTGTLARTSRYSSFLSGPGVYWLYDARTFFGDINFGFSFDQSSDDAERGSWTAFTVGLLYPFLDRDFTPFAGGGVGYGSLTVDGIHGSGLLLYGDVGAIFGRSSSVHFRGDVKPFLTTFPLDQETWFGGPAVTDDGRIGWGVQVALGVGF
jgi:hypothetical protein